MEVRILPMTLRDVDEVFQIERQVFPSPWAKGSFKRELKNRNHSLLLSAKSDDEVLGYVGLFYVYDEGHITNLAVKPEFQGKGIGALLLLELIKAALLKGVKRLVLEVRESNRVAFSLYRKFEFQPTGVRKDYYLDTREDALVLENEALSSPRYRERLNKIEEEVTIRLQSSKE